MSVFVPYGEKIMAEIMKKRAEKIKEATREAIHLNNWTIRSEGAREFVATTMYDGTQNDGDYEVKIEINEDLGIVKATSFFLRDVNINDEMIMLITEFNRYVSIGSFILVGDMIGFKSDLPYHDSLIEIWAITEFLSNVEFCMDNADDLLDMFNKGLRSFHYCEEEFAKRLGIYYDGYFYDEKEVDKQYERMKVAIEKSGYEIKQIVSQARMCHILKYNGGVPLGIYCFVVGEGSVIRIACHIESSFKEEDEAKGARASLLLSNLAKIGTCEMPEDHIMLKIDIHYNGSIISKALIGYMIDEAIEFGEKYSDLIYKLADGAISYGEFAIRALHL